MISMLLAISINLFPKDATPDNEENRGAKFRGAIYLSGRYKFSNNPRTVNNHLGSIDYNFHYDYTDKGDPKNKHHTTDDPGTILAPSKANVFGSIYAYYQAQIPFLTGNHFLIRDNKVTLTTSFSVSPISLTGGLSVKFQPAAFFNVAGGVRLGTGWNIDALGGYGLARNNKSGIIKDQKRSIITDDHFFGPVFESWFSATLQLDLAAIMPSEYKRWTHVLVSATPVVYSITLLNYAYYDRPFAWECDEYTLNGWSYYASFTVGYKILVIVDERKELVEKRQFLGIAKHNNFDISLLFTAALMGNITHVNDSPMANGWGSDFVTCQFGPMIDFELPYNFKVLIGTTFMNKIAYTEETMGNLDESNRKYSDWYVQWDNIYVSFGWSF